MYLIAIDIEYRVVIGISAMVILFASFLIAFVISQRKKLQYHKDLRMLYSKQKEFLTEQNEMLEQGVRERTAALVEQTEALQNALVNLKKAQAQLIQSEKMAFMGELTAGIAHEIQNPLNFVNNFSELNTELLQELEAAAAQGDMAEIKEIAKDVKENEQKINHHGKRAGTIIKAMLQHTRMGIGKGQKEAIDLNAVVDECLRLSYHSFRAKNMQLPASHAVDVTLHKAYDSKLSADEAGNGTILIVLQDISRALLNLFNNAFYAVNEKRKNLFALNNNTPYEPAVWVTTTYNSLPPGAGTIEICIQDNGNGIPQNNIDKIFQPFFTTKPSGEGTGLGLSLSYDVIKAHGGHIKVESKEGEGSIFTIQLPS